MRCSPSSSVCKTRGVAGRYRGLRAGVETTAADVRRRRKVNDFTPALTYIAHVGYKAGMLGKYLLERQDPTKFQPVVRMAAALTSTPPSTMIAAQPVTSSPTNCSMLATRLPFSATDPFTGEIVPNSGTAVLTPLILRVHGVFTPTSIYQNARDGVKKKLHVLVVSEFICSGATCQ